MPNDFSDSNDELFQYNRKINTFSLLSLGLIHYFSSHCICYFLFTCCCPSKDTLRKTRVRSYLPHLLVQKWYFCLCSCFRNHGDSLLTWAAAASFILVTHWGRSCPVSPPPTTALDPSPSSSAFWDTSPLLWMFVLSGELDELDAFYWLADGVKRRWL